MLTLIDPKATVQYTLQSDQDDPTVFELRSLTAREKLRVFANAEGGALGVTGMEYAVRFGLVGWTNGSRDFDPNDQLANIDSLPDLAFAEIASEVLRLSGLGVEAKKK